ncbi:MAG: 4-hydroxy-tetrahydrodipicolinate reductase, partial [Alphaproteobacteria bacterium]|nr:4-hydroxy-tetrahydrodipicolinate reductase [Alphaproteobacteria bacterium]
MANLKIGVVGMAGHMGVLLAREAASTAGCLLVGGTERKGHPAIGRDVGAVAGLDPIGKALNEDPAALFRQADAVLDFTAPAASALHAELAAKHRKILIVGTTGLGPAEDKRIAAAARRTVIVRAPNMSPAVNWLMQLTRRTAAAFGEDYDIEIVEMHHRRKVDAPSGTALGLGEAAAAGRGRKLADL